MTTTSPCVDCFVKAARSRPPRLVRFTYLKHLARDRNVPRVVEPYTFVEGQQDLMIRCYQLEPDEGWRYFMAHKLDGAEVTSATFKPRRRITLPSGVVLEETQGTQRPAWSDPARAYRDLVSDAMADGHVTPEEQQTLKAAQTPLTSSEFKYVHAAIAHRCLGAVLDDGVIDAGELQQIRYVFSVLDRLGWAPDMHA